MKIALVAQYVLRRGGVPNYVAALAGALAAHIEGKGFDIINAHGDYTATANVITSHYCEAARLNDCTGGGWT